MHLSPLATDPSGSAVPSQGAAPVVSSILRPGQAPQVGSSSSTPGDPARRAAVGAGVTGGDIAGLAGRAAPATGAEAAAPSFQLGSLDTGTDMGTGAGGVAFMDANRNLTATISRPRQLGDGSYQLRAALTPAALGQVDATVKVDGANVEVTLVAHTAAGHQQLQANLDQLRRELGSGGGHVAVTLSDGRRQSTRDSSSGGQQAAPDDTDDPSSLSTQTLTTTLPGLADRSLHVIL